MTVSLAVKVELDPTVPQRRSMASIIGACRVVYNACIRRSKLEYQVAKAKGEKSSHKDYSEYTRLKRDELPWLADAAPANAVNQALRNLGTARQNFIASITGKRKGPKVGPPKFRSRDRSASFQYQGSGEFLTDGGIKIPKLGVVRWKEDPRSRIGRTAGQPVITVTRVAGRWYASIPTTIDRLNVFPRPELPVVGVDLNTWGMALSTGERIEVPDELAKAEARRKRAQRVMSRRVKGSARRFAAKCNVARLYAREKRIREDWLHKTSRRLVTEHSLVVLEDLSVRGMTRSAKGTVAEPGKNVRQKAGLNRAMLRVSFSELRRQVTYKADWYGAEVLVLDQRKHPSTQTCSGCQHRKTGDDKVRLGQKVYSCAECGLTIDRDLNAALNLKFWGDSLSKSTRGHRGTNERGVSIRLSGGHESVTPADAAADVEALTGGRPRKHREQPRGADDEKARKTGDRPRRRARAKPTGAKVSKDDSNGAVQSPVATALGSAR